jgi:ABC-type uncharacterized transport system substrate-binding protein
MGLGGRIVLLILLVFGMKNMAVAKNHPHVFITAQITVVYNPQGIAGIKVLWAFDEMFTELMLNDYDPNKDLIFDAKETQNLKDEAFSNLKNFGYFTHIYVNGNQIDINTVKDFKATVNNGQMVYTFYIPTSIVATSDYKKVNIYLFDENYYMDMYLQSDFPVRFENASPFSFTYDIIEDETKSFYFNQIYPQVIRLKFRKK